MLPRMDGELTLWPVGQVKIYSQVTLKDIHILAATLRLSERYANNIVQRFCDQIFECADQLIASHQSSNSSVLAKEGQLTLLRSIWYGVINDIVKQLTSD